MNPQSHSERGTEAKQAGGLCKQTRALTQPPPPPSMGASCSCIDDVLEDRRLRGCNSSNTLKFIPNVTRAKVVSVYDGDTITVAARISRRSQPFLFKVRLAGIDAPELRGSKSAEEKQAAVAARDYLRDLLQDKCVDLKNVETEKYGRLLATVKLRGKDVSRLLLDRGHAVQYDGGTKPSFETSAKA